MITAFIRALAVIRPKIWERTRPTWAGPDDSMHHGQPCVCPWCLWHRGKIVTKPDGWVTPTAESIRRKGILDHAAAAGWTAEEIAATAHCRFTDEAIATVAEYRRRERTEK